MLEFNFLKQELQKKLKTGVTPHRLLVCHDCDQLYVLFLLYWMGTGRKRNICKCCPMRFVRSARIDCDLGKWYCHLCNMEHTGATFAIFGFAAALGRVRFSCRIGWPAFFVAFKIAESLRYFSAYCNLRLIQFFSGWITSGVSFITLSAISVDRLLALILHLRYKNIITVRRVIIAVIVVWLVCSIVTILKFWVQNWIIIAVCTNLSAAVLIAFCTGKIFRIARRHERRIKEQNVAITLNPSLAGDFNVRKCKKSAMTVIYIFGLMLMLYIPFFAVMAVEIIKGKTNLVKVAYEWASLIVFINSSVNPVIYCWRMKQIRNGIKRFFGRLICPRIASSCCIQLVGLAAGSERS